MKGQYAVSDSNYLAKYTLSILSNTDKSIIQFKLMPSILANCNCYLVFL